MQHLGDERLQVEPLGEGRADGVIEALEVALYHNLGRLPEPESTHEFC